MHPRDVTCSPGFRATAIGEYPALAESRAYARLFGWLCFGTWRCEHTKALMIPAALLAQLERREYLLKSGNYVGRTYLDGFSRDIAPINFGSWSGTAGVCRKIIGLTHNPDLPRAQPTRYQAHAGVSPCVGHYYLGDHQHEQQVQQRHTPCITRDHGSA